MWSRAGGSIRERREHGDDMSAGLAKVEWGDLAGEPAADVSVLEAVQQGCVSGRKWWRVVTGRQLRGDLACLNQVVRVLPRNAPALLDVLPPAAVLRLPARPLLVAELAQRLACVAVVAKES